MGREVTSEMARNITYEANKKIQEMIICKAKVMINRINRLITREAKRGCYSTDFEISDCDSLTEIEDNVKNYFESAGFVVSISEGTTYEYIKISWYDEKRMHNESNI